MPPSQDSMNGTEQNPLLEMENGSASGPRASGSSNAQQYTGFSRIQVLSMILAQLLSAISVLLALYWAHLLGGLSWQTSKQAFNWHPVMMVIAFAVMTVSMISFRLKYMPTRSWAKRVHYMGWLVAALCATVGLIAVFHSHNAGYNGYIANMYSLHSWIGATVILLYLGQLVVGAMTFLGYTPAWWSRILERTHPSTILSIHYFLGPVVYCGTMATILLGLQEKEKFMECSYSNILKRPDYLPFLHFLDIPWVCRVSHFLALGIFLTTLCVIIALHDFQRGSHSYRRDRAS
jgi:hypothetical protein